MFTDMKQKKKYGKSRHGTKTLSLIRAEKIYGKGRNEDEKKTVRDGSQK